MPNITSYERVHISQDTCVAIMKLQPLLQSLSSSSQLIKFSPYFCMYCHIMVKQWYSLSYACLIYLSAYYLFTINFHLRCMHLSLSSFRAYWHKIICIPEYIYIYIYIISLDLYFCKYLSLPLSLFKSFSTYM